MSIYKITYKVGNSIKDAIVEAPCIEKIISNTTGGEYPFLYVDDETIINPRYIIKIEKFENNVKRSPKNNHPGVTWDKTNKIWKVRAYVNGKAKYIGSSTNFETAMKIQKDAENKL